MEQTQKFFDLLLDIRRLYVEDMNALLTTHQLSSAQWLIFKEIAKKEPTTLVEVARSRKIEKPTATKVIHKLIELNLIQTSEGKDKREKILNLTDFGKQHYEMMLKDVIQKQKDISGEIEELQVVTEQLEKIYKHLESGKEERIGRTH
ncbi:MarR family winged helix-turn-helix transcriptional regulator [Macrococcus carouselicus]|uniref:MarR family transcriptional regulator n=1 Tax=Macrococcus carouselicus TaxID=69969 RepID=A0A9Q8CKJ3_9STAP|nr:MarR family transcriptional regulator [Macrococcus carouselicus]TDM02319.1 MarR family transcriptional regulator [Macrococcus carouselicus]